MLIENTLQLWALVFLFTLSLAWTLHAHGDNVDHPLSAFARRTLIPSAIIRTNVSAYRGGPVFVNVSERPESAALMPGN